MPCPAAVCTRDGRRGARSCMLCFLEVADAMKPEMLFYDGHCGLCHGAVQFVLKRDPSGNAFRFAPLQGSTFPAMVRPEQRVALPDSIVVLTEEGSLLARSDAVIYVLRKLGGAWRFWGGVLEAIPRPLRDFGYDFVAKIRYRVFGKRDDLCPLMPPGLRTRFDP